MYDIIIIGAGPAGMTAALYSLRANKSVLLIEKRVFGGQITYSPKVENYPGFEQISGNDFSMKLHDQIVKLGAEFAIDEAVSVVDNGDNKTVVCKNNRYECRAVIFATGADHRCLNVPGENDFLGKGVSYCAVCDGTFFTNKITAVVGGGNSALQEAIYLSDICQKVYLIHRRADFRADKFLVDKLSNINNITVIKNSEVYEITGESAVGNVGVLNILSGRKTQIPVNGVFISIGLAPQNEAFSGLIQLDESGHAEVDDECTAKGGIYVAGDCRKKSVHQLTTAIGDGATAAVNACRYIDNTL